MPVVRMPDGTNVRFPDDMPAEQIRGLIQQRFPEAVSGAPAAQTGGLASAVGASAPVAEGDPRDSLLGRIDAGVRGAADVLSFGLADEIAAGLSTGGGLWGDYGQALEQERAIDEADSEDRFGWRLGGQIAGALTGGAGMARAGLSPTANAINANASLGRVAATSALEGAGLGAAAGFGAGEGAQDRVAEALLGAGVGGALGAGLGAWAGRSAQSAARAAVPDTEALRAARTAAYQQADQLGVRYSQRGYEDLVDSMLQAAQDGRINSFRHPRAFSLLEEFNSMRGGSPTLTELDQLRQVVRRDVASSTDEAEQFFGNMMIREIDRFIDSADALQTASGDPQAAAEAIREARRLQGIFRRSEAIDDAVTRAERRAASTYAGANVDNATRQNVRGILDSPRRRQGYSAAELEALETIVRGTRGQNALRLAGRLSPQSGGLMSALGITGTAINPMMAIPFGVGAAARPLADRMTRNNLEFARALIRSGGNIPSTQISPSRQAIIDALLLEGTSLATGQ